MNDQLMVSTKDKKSRIWPRAKNDWYVEDIRADHGLFKAERFVGSIWDASCGQGNVLESAIQAGYPVVGTDLVRRTDRYWFHGTYDFFEWNDQPLAQNIASNPPYKDGLAEKFIRKALTLVTGKLCIFVEMRFITGAERAATLYTEHCPHRCWIITPRVSCPPGEYLLAGGRASGGQPDHCWLVWDLTAPPAHGMLTDWLYVGPSIAESKSEA